MLQSLWAIDLTRRVIACSQGYTMLFHYTGWSRVNTGSDSVEYFLLYL